MKMILFLLISWTLTSFAQDRKVPDPFEKAYTIGTYRGESAKQQCYQSKNSFEKISATIQDEQFSLIESSCYPIGSEAYRFSIKYFSDFSSEFKREKITLVSEHSCASQVAYAREQFTAAEWTVFEAKCDTENLKADFLLYKDYSHTLDQVTLGPYHTSKTNCMMYQPNADFGSNQAPISLGKYCESIRIGIDGDIFYRQIEQFLRPLGKNIKHLSGQSFTDLSSCLQRLPSSTPFVEEGLGVFDITCKRLGAEEFITTIILNDDLLTKVVDYSGLSYENLNQCRDALDSLEKSLSKQRRSLLYGYCQVYTTEVKLMAFTTRATYKAEETF
jgi:hypothetical protein